MFDRIILDPPCSGLGNRPRFDDDMTLPNLLGFSVYQKKLVDVAVRLLKVGGTMTYSTCTIHPEENEEMVAFILEKYGKSIKLAPIPSKFFLGLPVCCDSWSSLRFFSFMDHHLQGLSTSSLTAEQQQMVQRFDPGHDKTDTIGFFIAKFEKIAEISVAAATATSDA